MKVRALKLWNFRKYGCKNPLDLDKPNLLVPFTDGLNVLIGENDSGKTAIIDAIKLILKTHSYERIWVTEDDFHSTEDVFRIELIFDDLKPEEAKHFLEWLGWEKVNGKKTAYLRLILQVEKKTDQVKPFEVKAGVDEIGYQMNAQAREYLKCTYLKPLRDAESELISKRGSRLSQILGAHPILSNRKGAHDLEGYMSDFNKKVELYFDDTKKGEPIKTQIQNDTQTFIDGSKEISIKSSNGSLKSILENLNLSLKGVIKPGLGSLNRLFMAAELLHLERKNWTGVKLGLIEELEAHIHPQAQMKVIESLQQKKDIQLIITTHSPNLVSKVKLNNLLICSKQKVFSLQEGNTKLKPADYSFLERFLDVTKSNLFFSSGLILVEGWAEEILVPIIAKMIGFDLTEHGVSVVNIGHTNFIRYVKIFQQKNDLNQWNKPVSIIRDLDLRPDEYLESSKYKNGLEKYLKKEEVKEGFDKDVATESYQKKVNIRSIVDEKAHKKKLKEGYEDDNIKMWISPNWTLEYCLALSEGVMGKQVKALVQEMNENAKFDNSNVNQYAYDIYSKYLAKGKSEFAQLLAGKIEKNVTKESLNNDDQLKYIIKAIKHACKQN